MADEKKKSKTGLYIGGAILLLILIVAAIMMYKKWKAKQDADKAAALAAANITHVATPTTNAGGQPAVILTPVTPVNPYANMSLSELYQAALFQNRAASNASLKYATAATNPGNASAAGLSISIDGNGQTVGTPVYVPTPSGVQTGRTSGPIRH